MLYLLTVNQQLASVISARITEGEGYPTAPGNVTLRHADVDKHPADNIWAYPLDDIVTIKHMARWLSRSVDRQTVRDALQRLRAGTSTREDVTVQIGAQAVTVRLAERDETWRPQETP